MKNRTRNAIKWSYEDQGLSGRRGQAIAQGIGLESIR